MAAPPLTTEERVALWACLEEAREWERRRAGNDYIDDASRRVEDLDALLRVLDYDLSERSREAFETFARKLVQPFEMRRGDVRESTRSFPSYSLHHLPGRVHAWVIGELEKWEPPVTRLTGGPIPRGREVSTPTVLRNLPKRPPGR